MTNVEEVRGFARTSNNKSNSNSQYGDLSTAHDMKPSCFGRDDKIWGGLRRAVASRYPTTPPQQAKALAGDPGFAKYAKGRAPRVVVSEGGWGGADTQVCAAAEKQIPFRNGN